MMEVTQNTDTEQRKTEDLNTHIRLLGEMEAHGKTADKNEPNDGTVEVKLKQ